MKREDLTPFIWDACHNWIPIHVGGIDVTRVLVYDLLQMVYGNLRETTNG